MKRWIQRMALLFGLCSVLVAATFWLIQQFYPELFITILAEIDHPGIASATLTTGLLALDVYLPVPSNILLTLNGKLYGGYGGLLLNLAGGILSGIVAWYTGRYFLKNTTKELSGNEHEHASQLILKWGLFAIVVSRPIPILAEAVAVTAAASGITAGKFMLGIFLGTLPIALIYALAGAYIHDAPSGILCIAAVLIVSLGSFEWGRRRAGSLSKNYSDTPSETNAPASS